MNFEKGLGFSFFIYFFIFYFFFIIFFPLKVSECSLIFTSIFLQTNYIKKNVLNNQMICFSIIFSVCRSNHLHQTLLYLHPHTQYLLQNIPNFLRLVANTLCRHKHPNNIFTFNNNTNYLTNNFNIFNKIHNN